MSLFIEASRTVERTGYLRSVDVPEIRIHYDARDPTAGGTQASSLLDMAGSFVRVTNMESCSRKDGNKDDDGDDFFIARVRILPSSAEGKGAFVSASLAQCFNGLRTKYRLRISPPLSMQNIAIATHIRISLIDSNDARVRSLRSLATTGFLARRLAGVVLRRGAHVGLRWWSNTMHFIRIHCVDIRNDADKRDDKNVVGIVHPTQTRVIVRVGRESSIERDLLAVGEDRWIRRISRDVGGVDSAVLQIVRSLRRALWSGHCGGRCSKGILVHGNASGKSALVAAAANAAATFCEGLSVQILRAQDIFRSIEGDSEARLNYRMRIAASEAPCVVIIDDVDLLAADRRRGSSSTLSQQICAQFKRELEHIWRRQIGVVVLATTSRLSAIDPDVRSRPSGFGCVISMPSLDAQGRVAALSIMTRDMRIAPDVDLDTIGAVSAGFSGADLEKLCREAVIVRSNDAATDEGRTAILQQRDFDRALTRVKPSGAIRAARRRRDHAGNDVSVCPGYAREADLLRSTILLPLLYPQRLASLGVSPPKGMLIYGPSGVGKTFIARRLARSCEGKANFLNVSCPSLLSKVVGETERNVAKLFARARSVAPAIMFLDHVECLAPVRETGDSAENTMDRLLSCLLIEMDGVVGHSSSESAVIVVAATERREMLDPAILRPGRLEVHVEMKRPREEARKEIFGFYLSRMSTNAGDSDTTAALSGKLAKWIGDGATGSDIEGACRSAAMRAMKRGDAVVCERHFAI